MSHSLGAVKLSNGNIYYFEYNGTVDVCRPKLYKTIKEVYDNWRSIEWEYHDNKCNKIEDAIMCSTYGGGFGWTVKVCEEHMLIVDNHASDAELDGDYNRYDGMTDWLEEKLRNQK